MTLPEGLAKIGQIKRCVVWSTYKVKLEYSSFKQEFIFICQLAFMFQIFLCIFLDIMLVSDMLLFETPVILLSYALIHCNNFATETILND